jgi:hypothetical protein
MQQGRCMRECAAEMKQLASCMSLPSHDVTLTGRGRVGNDVRGEQTIGMPQRRLQTCDWLY